MLRPVLFHSPRLHNICNGDGSDCAEDPSQVPSFQSSTSIVHSIPKYWWLKSYILLALLWLQCSAYIETGIIDFSLHVEGTGEVLCHLVFGCLLGESFTFDLYLYLYLYLYLLGVSFTFNSFVAYISSFQLDGPDNLVQLPKRGLQDLSAWELQQQLHVRTDVVAAGQDKEENREEKLCSSSQQTLHRKRIRVETGRKNKDAQQKFSLQSCFFESEEPRVCRLRWKDANDAKVWSSCPSWEERAYAAGEEGGDDRGGVEEICSSGRQVSAPPYTHLQIRPNTFEDL